MGVGDLIEKAKESASAITDKIVEIKENLIGEESKAIMDEFKEAGSSKVKEIVEMLEDSKNYITRSGYEFSSVHVSLGLPPEIGLSFNYKSEVGEAERTQLMEEVKDRKVLSIILKCLFKAGDFYAAAKFKEYKLGSVDISLGLTPGVNINFVR
jgi:hypothetical protein